MADATKHSKIAFLAPNIKQVGYANGVSITLPKLPDTNDTVIFRAHFLGTGAGMAMTIGSTLIASVTVTNGYDAVWDVSVTNVGSGDFVVIGTVIESLSGSTGGAQTSFTDTITELMADNELTLSFSNTNASERYIIVST